MTVIDDFATSDDWDETHRCPMRSGKSVRYGDRERSHLATDVICGLCNQHYDADLQMPVCPHLLIEDVERKRKAEAEDKLIKAKKK